MPELLGGRPPELPPINRDDDRPVFEQLAEILRQKILAGEFHPGEKCPPRPGWWKRTRSAN